MKSLYQHSGYEVLPSRFSAKISNNCEAVTSKELVKEKQAYDKFLSDEIQCIADRLSDNERDLNRMDKGVLNRAFKRQDQGKKLTRRQQKAVTDILTPSEVICEEEQLAQLKEAKNILNHPEGVKTYQALEDLMMCYHPERVRDEATTEVETSTNSSLLEMQVSDCPIEGNNRFGCDTETDTLDSVVRRTTREEVVARTDTNTTTTDATRTTSNRTESRTATSTRRESARNSREKQVTVYETALGEVDVLATNSAETLATYPAGRQLIKAMIEKYIKQNPDYANVFMTKEAFDNSPYESGNVISTNLPDGAEFNLTAEEEAFAKTALFREKTNQFYDKAANEAIKYPNITTENLWDGGKVLSFIDYSGSRTPNGEKAITKYIMSIAGDGKISLKQSQDFAGNIAQEWTNNDTYNFALEEIDAEDGSIGGMRSSENGPWMDGRDNATGEYSINSNFKIKGNKNKFQNQRSGEAYTLSKLTDFEAAFARAKQYSGDEINGQLT